jgi:hypothetical protein
VDPVEPVLRNRLTHGGIPLWTMWDQVHRVDEAYQEMAEAILLPGTEDAASPSMGRRSAQSPAWEAKRGEGRRP